MQNVARMRRRLRRLPALVWFLLVLVVVIFLLLWLDIDDDSDDDVVRGPELCLLVPFRDRFDELMFFMPHMAGFLKAQNIRYKTFIVNQSDGLRFNRASLINAGFKETTARSDCDYVAMHDVDLLPLNPNLSYKMPPESGPLHLSPPGMH